MNKTSPNQTFCKGCLLLVKKKKTLQGTCAIGGPIKGRSAGCVVKPAEEDGK